MVYDSTMISEIQLYDAQATEYFKTVISQCYVTTIFFKFAMFIRTRTGIRPMVLFNRFNSLSNCFIAEWVRIDRDDLSKVIE